MKKIGLATPYRVANYGTKLQAYALQTFLAKECCIDVEIINYNPSDDHSFLATIRKVLSGGRLINKIMKIIRPWKNQQVLDSKISKQRNQIINMFDRRFYLSKRVDKFNDLKKQSETYSLIFAGSDQIWVPRNIRDKYFTLEFCAASVIRASYAASFGVEALSASQKKVYAHFLDGLNFISVREESGRYLAQALIPSKTVEWVCDPTLLLNDDYYREIEQRPDSLRNVKEGYVFCYFLGTTSKHREIVYEYAKAHNLKILTVANFRGYCEADTALTDIQLYDLNVEEFLYLIDHATLVCTDSMHATIFSTIFETNFWTFERFKKDDKNSRNSRIYSLLRVMGLESRLVSFDVLPEEKIDFAKVKPLKDQYVGKSIEYIEKVIENVH